MLKWLRLKRHFRFVFFFFLPTFIKAKQCVNIFQKFHQNYFREFSGNFQAEGFSTHCEVERQRSSSLKQYFGMARSLSKRRDSNSLPCQPLPLPFSVFQASNPGSSSYLGFEVQPQNFILKSFLGNSQILPPFVASLPYLQD